MARMNNQDRSLKIIARQNGWDPDAIVGDAYKPNENRVYGGDYLDIPGSMADPDAVDDGSKPHAASGEMPPKSHRTGSADPYGPGKMEG